MLAMVKYLTNVNLSTDLHVSATDSTVDYERYILKMNGWRLMGGATSEVNPGTEFKLVDNALDGEYGIRGPNAPSEANPFYLIYEGFAGPVVINKYKIFRSTTNYPRSWTFEGSNDYTYSNWVTLDSTYSAVDTLDAPTGAEEAVLNASNDAYQFYRFKFTSGVDTTTPYDISLREIEFFKSFTRLDKISIGNVEHSNSFIPSEQGAFTGQPLVYDLARWRPMNPVAFRVYKSASGPVTYASNNPGTVIDFDTVLFDTRGRWSNVNHDYTVPLGGIYQVGFHGGTPDDSDESAKVRIMHYDGSTWNVAAEFGSQAGMANAGTTLIEASAGHKFQVVVRTEITFNVFDTALLSMFGHRIL